MFSTDKTILPKDIHNIVQQFKLKEKVGSLESRVDRVLQEFAVESGNTARVLTNADGTACCISIQTRKMRQMMEVVMVDATHGKRRIISNYRKLLLEDIANALFFVRVENKLFSFMVHDICGKEQFVLHSFLDRETASNFRHVAHTIKRNNPSWEKIAVIVV